MIDPKDQPPGRPLTPCERLKLWTLTGMRLPVRSLAERRRYEMERPDKPWELDRSA